MHSRTVKSSSKEMGDRERFSRQGVPDLHTVVSSSIRATREGARLQGDPKGTKVLLTRLQQGLKEARSPEFKREEEAPSTWGSMQIRRQARGEEGTLPGGITSLGIDPELKQGLPMPHERLSTLEESALLDQAIEGAKSTVRQGAQSTQDKGVTRQHGREPKPHRRSPSRGVAATGAKAGRQRWVSTLVDA